MKPPVTRHQFKNYKGDHSYCQVWVSGFMSTIYDPDSCARPKEEHADPDCACPDHPKETK